MANPGLMPDHSDEVIDGRSFRSLDLSLAKFRRARLTNCVFFACDLSNVDFRNAVLDNVRFVKCRFQKPEFTGATLENCNIEVMDCRIAGRGYVVVMSPEGWTIGCMPNMPWERFGQLDQREILTLDKRNAIIWWDRFRESIRDAAAKRGWL